MRFRVLVLAALMAVPSVAAAEMSMSFEWGRMPRCTTGKPMAVPNPKIIIKEVPEGATHLQLWMTDLDDPWRNHGTKRLKLTATGDMTIPAGLFYYAGPCPKNAIHTFQWNVTAYKGIKPLYTAWMRRNYPE